MQATEAGVDTEMKANALKCKRRSLVVELMVLLDARLAELEEGRQGRDKILKLRAEHQDKLIVGLLLGIEHD